MFQESMDNKHTPSEQSTYLLFLNGVKQEILFCCGRGPSSVGKGKPETSDTVEHLTRKVSTAGNNWQNPYSKCVLSLSPDYFLQFLLPR